jgi:hypothetical protein
MSTVELYAGRSQSKRLISGLGSGLRRDIYENPFIFRMARSPDNHCYGRWTSERCGHKYESDVGDIEAAVTGRIRAESIRQRLSSGLTQLGKTPFLNLQQLTPTLLQQK